MDPRPSAPDDQELRTTLQRDLDGKRPAAAAPASTGRRILLALCWIGLVLSIGMVGAAVWFHFTMDDILRIPFVFITAGAGLMLGVPCLSYLLTGKFTGPPNPFF